MRKKIVFSMVGDNSDGFGKNAGKHIKINMANGGVVYVPIIEIEGNNAMELKQNMSKLLNLFIDTLTDEKKKRQEELMVDVYGLMFYMSKVIAVAMVGLVALLVL